MKIRPWHIMPLIIFLTSVYLIMSGSDLLIKPLSYEPFIPMGTLISWLGIISLGLILLVLTSEVVDKIGLFNQLLRLLVKLIFGLSVLWAPISYILSGNFAFNFSENNTMLDHLLAGKIFWYFTYLLAGAAIICFLILALILLHKSRKISK